METKNKEIRLEFNMGLYRYDPIILAADEFSKNFWIIIDRVSNKVIVYLKPKDIAKDAGIKNLGYEFYNYVLGLMQATAKKQSL